MVFDINKNSEMKYSFRIEQKHKTTASSGECVAYLIRYPNQYYWIDAIDGWTFIFIFSFPQWKNCELNKNIFIRNIFLEN